MPQQNKINPNKKKKKKLNSDTIAVLFIFAVIVLVGILLSWLQRDGSRMNLSHATTTVSKAQSTNNDVVIITVGVIAVIIVAIFVFIKISSVRKKRRILEAKLKKQRVLEEARKRVEAAKYGDILAAGSNAIKERKRAEEVLENQSKSIKHKYDLNKIDELNDEYLDEIKHSHYGDGNDRLVRADNRRYKSQNLRDYDEDAKYKSLINDNDDYDEENYESFLTRIKHSDKKIAIFGALAVTIIAVLILVFVLI